MPAARAGQRVVEHVRRVGAALGKRSRSSEIQVARDDHLRQSDRTRDAVSDAEIEGVELRRRKRSADQSAAPEARFVQKRASKDVRLVERQDARARPRHLSETRNAIALRARFNRFHPLGAIEPLNAIVLARAVTDIDR